MSLTGAESFPDRRGNAFSTKEASTLYGGETPLFKMFFSTQKEHAVVKIRVLRDSKSKLLKCEHLHKNTTQDLKFSQRWL
jgi:hypothetical protein